MHQQNRKYRIVDCHLHVTDPIRFPYLPNTDYQPKPHEAAPVDLLLAVMDANGVDCGVVITPTAGYGSANDVTSHAIYHAHGRLKGIAVYDGTPDIAALAALHAAGFIGIRFDLTVRGISYLSGKGQEMLGLLNELGMILDVQVFGANLIEATTLLREYKGPFVIDHMGRPDPKETKSGLGFSSLLRLSENENAFVKLSGPFRFSQQQYPYDDADSFATALIHAYGPDRCMWGSDWPFLRMAHRLDYGPSLTALDRWVSSDTDLHKILWDTPARFFGFSESSVQ